MVIAPAEDGSVNLLGFSPAAPLPLFFRAPQGRSPPLLFV